jgi:hypothetical protein
MNRKILLFGFVIVLLVAVPLTVWLVSLQTKVNVGAQKSTNLSFAPLSGPVNVGDSINLSLLLDPGTNQISFLKVVLSYNKKYLQRDSITLDSRYFPVPLEGPTYDQCTGDICTMSIASSIGTDVSKIIKTGGIPTTIGTASFKALISTANNSTVINFAGGTQALSLASADAPSENVLQTPQPLSLTIIGPTPSPTSEATNTPAPTNSGGNNNNSGGNNNNSGGNVVPTATNSNAPVCSSFVADNTTASNAPLTVNFTAVGSSPNSTISKVTMNFGDSNVQDVTTGGGIGTATVTGAQAAHIYQTIGTFTATATFTDANGNVSNPTACSKTITIGQAAATATPASGGTTKGGLPNTGPGDKFIGAGIAGVVVVIGGLLLLAL